jgi:hypothetical protein
MNGRCLFEFHSDIPIAREIYALEIFRDRVFAQSARISQHLNWALNGIKTFVLALSLQDGAWLSDSRELNHTDRFLSLSGGPAILYPHGRRRNSRSNEGEWNRAIE